MLALFNQWGSLWSCV